MKTTLLAFVLLFALSSQLLLGAAEASPDQVVDTSDKVLRAGVNYNILLSMPYTSCRSPQGLGLSRMVVLLAISINQMIDRNTE
ncbi:miraculin protein [Spatholobus suberectus]|nr:miraculin protein [Spatholobus suberectus]